MQCLALILYFMLLPDSAFTYLPAPLNVSVISLNFHHVMRWDPGPGTPPHTQYRIYMRLTGNKKREKQLNSTTTSLKLNLIKNSIYILTVRASYNHTLSPESDRCVFAPYKDTKIGPPEVSLAGCGNCIQVNISLPKADRSSGIDDIQKFYASSFRIFWKSENKKNSSHPSWLFKESLVTQNKSLTLRNLNRGEEYCVQVHTEITLNKNTVPSSLKCIFTSIVEQRKDLVIIGGVAVLLIFFVSALITFMLCLHYTGFLCKLKALPTVLMALGQGYTLTQERTIPDPVSINSQIEKQRQHNDPTMQLQAVENEDEDEEEEEQINVYIDRAARCFAGESLSLGSGNMSMHSEPAAAADCESLTERLSAEVELSDAEFDDGVTLGGLDEDLVKAEGTKEKNDEMKKEKVFESFGNVNLFSVTLAALTVGEEEEEEQNAKEPLSNLLRLSDLEPLQTVQKWRLSNTDSQTQSDD